MTTIMYVFIFIFIIIASIIYILICIEDMENKKIKPTGRIIRSWDTNFIYSDAIGWYGWSNKKPVKGDEFRYVTTDGRVVGYLVYCVKSSNAIYQPEDMFFMKLDYSKLISEFKNKEEEFLKSKEYQ